jgi:hypothetical protein
MLCVVSACQKPDIKFGDQFLDNGITQITKIDTFGVDLSTVYTDSFPTSAKGVTLVGGYSDPYFGRIDTKTYFEIAPPSTTASDFTRAVYDSLYLTLRLNQSYYGDTTQPVHINISRLNQVILAPYINGVPGYYLFNIDKLAVNPTPLGSTDVLIRPHLTDSIHIKLDDALGKDLFAKIKTNDPIIQNTTNFLNYFYGLCISSNGNSSLVFGCKDSLDFKLMYHLPSLYRDSLTVKFGINNSSHHYTNISVNRTGSILQNLGPALASGKSNNISSKATKNMAFTQAASSTMIKIRFPSIQNIFYTTNFSKILRAVLILKPVQGSYSPFYYLPPQLRLSTTNYSNSLGTDLTALTGSGSYATQYGNLFLDYFNGQTSYSYDITNYIKSISVDGLYPYNQDGLLLVPPSPAFETQFSRAIFGDKNNSVANNRVELDIYYATVNTN